MPKRLGRGLKALIPEYSSDENRYLEDGIPVDNIVANKSQPRQIFSKEGMEDLINSIKENGILQPLTLRDLGNGKYELIAGERRWRAAQAANLDTVPGYIIGIDADVEMLEYALIENIQRENLNSVEEAEGYALLSGKYDMTQEQIANKVGKSRVTISNSLRLLKLPPKIKNSLRKGDISPGHARAILQLRKSTQMLKVFNKVIKEKLSVRAVESIASDFINSKNTIIDSRKKTTKSSTISTYENKMISTFGTKVKIKKNRKGDGKITISFYSNDDLQRILELISSIKT